MTDEYASHDELLALLGPPVKRENGRGRYTCPVHKGGREKFPDLVLWDSGVLECMCGCSFKEIMRELRKNEPRPVQKAPANYQKKRSAPIGTLVDTYQYRDLAGAIIAEKSRWEKPSAIPGEKPDKTFLWRAFGEEGWNGGVSQADLALWGIEGLAEVPFDEWVYWVEGERAVNACVANGLVAVTSGSASTMPSAEALEELRGRMVALWPDNDVAGRRYVAKVRQSLRGIAKQTRIVVASGLPPKGDAVEYFQIGGTIEGLQTVTKPTDETMGLDHVRVWVPTDLGVVLFDFEQLTSAGRGELSCELTVRPDDCDEPYSLRINLLSSSARTTLRRELAAQFGVGVGEGGWTKVVSIAYARASDVWKNMERAKPMEHHPEGMRHTQFLVEILVPEREASMIFALPGVGKSYLSLALGLCVALGEPFAGYCTRQRSVLYIDYEEPDKQTQDFRCGRLLTGMGMDPGILPDLPIKWWPGGGLMLADQLPALQRHIEEHGTELIIVDSVASAVGSDLIDPVTALGYFNLLNRLGITSLSIGQEPSPSVLKDGTVKEQEKLYGGIYWQYGPHGRIWLLRSETTGHQDTKLLKLISKKVSNGRWPAPIPLAISFEGDAGPVTISRRGMGS